MLNKLRLKFILINMGIVAAMLLAIFATVYHFTKADLDRQSQDMLTRISQQGGLTESGREVQLPYFTIQLSFRGDMRVAGKTYFDLTDQEFLQELIEYVYMFSRTVGKVDKYDLRYMVSSTPGGQVLAFVDISGQQAALNSLVQGCALIGAGSLIAFLLISIPLAWWTVKPVEKAWAQQRQFVSDASHELKTPLTVIMSNAELLQQEQTDVESGQRFLSNITAASEQMRSLVEGLLELARSDNGRFQGVFAPVDLSKLIYEASLPFEPVLFERGMTLELDIQREITIQGSREHLRQVLEILLDNAGKYSDPGVVSVTLRRQGRNCLIAVSNPGQPIPKWELQRLFERFYRSDKARTDSGSFGLGLSIAQTYVREHGGQIWAQSNETGNCFYVQLSCE